MMAILTLPPSVEQKGPGDQPEVYYHELHIKPVFGLEAVCIYIQEIIGMLLDEKCDQDNR
jgi:hypothetical protein